MTIRQLDLAVVGYVVAAFVGVFIDQAAHLRQVNAVPDIEHSYLYFTLAHAMFNALAILPIWTAIVLFWKRFGRESLWYYCLSGLIIGLVSTSFLATMTDQISPDGITSTTHLDRLVDHLRDRGRWSAVRGVVAGATYWCIARL